MMMFEIGKSNAPPRLLVGRGSDSAGMVETNRIQRVKAHLSRFMVEPSVVAYR